VSFQEVPDETSLTILIGDCPFRCKGCHSPELQEAKGNNLLEDIGALIDKYDGAITCVCFMGEGRDEKGLLDCNQIAKERGLKTALYSGSDNAFARMLEFFDYIKQGPYIERLGGLDSPDTNQRMYKITRRDDGNGIYVENITKRFRKPAF